jgi:hypothetical protein
LSRSHWRSSPTASTYERRIVVAIYASFKKDWDETKSELKKLGHKKPTEEKKIGVWVFSIDKRVASGIGKALTRIDKAEPNDPKSPTSKELKEYRKAILDLRQAIASEIKLMDAEVNKYRGDDQKVAKEVKDGAYRALKIFKAKLDHYAAASSQQLIEYQNAVDATMDEGSKRINKFQSETKQRLTSGVVALKQVQMKPTGDGYNAALKGIKENIVAIEGEATTIANWFELKRQSEKGNMQEGAFLRVSHRAKNLPTLDRDAQEEAVRNAISGLSKLIKEALTTLAAVKLPKL